MLSLYNKNRIVIGREAVDMSKSQIMWEPDAEKMLKKAPFFVRKLARNKVEKAARENGVSLITAEFAKQVKNKEMRG